MDERLLLICYKHRFGVLIIFKINPNSAREIRQNMQQ